ncbi:NAD(P)/FAD-dependent oxidoreductase [Sphingomonas sp. PvP056]|jgi:protoporphyrinogen oxidase|uniref:NAD(P)/FAD-dependent oxidoreductase n=1 Tax=Sphingomonas sp. PvP056 TaxID=3156392 RepID=UPI00339218E3
MARVVVIGAGAMGLSAAYHAARAGHQVTVVEAGQVAGGMAAHFDFGGVSIERYYHFICTPDHPTFELLKELGIAEKLQWRRTSMGQFEGGKLYRWGDPVSLLTYPRLSLMAKLRYGLFAFTSTKRDHWDALETQSARTWIERWAGRETYQKLWEPLFRLKFYEYADDVSAAWIWTRIKRIGRSRSSIFAEKLGYLEGGTETLVDALVQQTEALGSKVVCGAAVSRVLVDNGRTVGVETVKGVFPADAVISTVPTPLISSMVPDLPVEWLARYDAIKNIGVCCLIFKLRKSVTPHFWVNITDDTIPIPGIIEFSNLRLFDNTIVFVPYYMPISNEKWAWTDERLLDEAFAALCKINPELTPEDRIDARVARLKHAQPICEPGFAAKIPPIQTPIAGLQIADTCFYYPEDRGISESVRLGREMAAHVGQA